MTSGSLRRVVATARAAALALDVLVVRRRRRFRMKDLHPALQA